MKHEDAKKLKGGQRVLHRRYGLCIVREVMVTAGLLFGVVIRPDNPHGRELLAEDCGYNIRDMLEDQPRNLSTENESTDPGYKPIDLETAWGEPEKDLPRQETKNHFAPEGEGVPE